MTAIITGTFNFMRTIFVALIAAAILAGVFYLGLMASEIIKEMQAVQAEHDQMRYENMILKGALEEERARSAAIAEMLAE
jgi:phosphopantetheine adenylyltransferase